MAAVSLVLLFAACLMLSAHRAASGTALAAERIDTGFAGAVRIDVLPDTGAQRGGDDAAVAAVLTDLNLFWSAALPADFRIAMTPLRGGYQSIDSAAAEFRSTTSTSCIRSPADITGNAYYCPDGDRILFDSTALTPVLLGHYGSAGLVGALAHEFGHAIQARIGPSAAERVAHPGSYPNLIVENGGDCYSGAFLSWVSAGRAPHLHLPSAAMVRAIGPMLDFQDPVDTAVGDPTAHGLALDRLRSILRGFRSGPTACRALTAGWVVPTLGRPSVSRNDALPRFASEALVLTAARTDLAEFVSTLRMADRLAAEARAVPSPSDLAAARPFGQFAYAATQAMSLGRIITGNDTAAACFTGAWTASVFGHSVPRALGSWAGDADEALNFLRSRPNATLEQLAGYADGFTSGWATCK